jgi:hypothetical protein
MSRFTTLLGTSVACAALAVAIPGGVLAAKGGNGAAKHAARAALQAPKPKRGNAAGNVAFGTLSGLSSTSATITTPGNTPVTVTIAAGTRFVANSFAAATAGLKNGEQVVASVAFNNGVTRARSIIYDTAAFNLPGQIRVTGTISSTGSGSFVLKLASGQTLTVTTNAQTRYVVGGKLATAAPALSANQTVQVLGQLRTDGTFVARAVGVAASS